MNKRAANVCIVVILMAIIISYIWVQDPAPARERGEKARRDTGDNTVEANGRAQDRGSVSTVGKPQGEEDDGPLTEEVREILLAYAEYLQKYCEERPHYADRMKFDLVYIDANNIPELAVIPSDVNSYDHVCMYTYKEGRVDLLGFFGGFGQCSFKPYANLIYSSSNTDEKSGFSAFYRLVGTTCVEQRRFFHSEYVGEFYELDGRPVSEKEYMDAWEGWDTDALDVWGYDDAVLVKGIDDLYGEMCRRYDEAVAQGGAEQFPDELPGGWNRQYLCFSEAAGEASVSLSDDLREADALIIEIYCCTPDLSFLEDMGQLKELWLILGQEADLSFLGSLAGLERLTIDVRAQSSALSFLKRLNQLTDIAIYKGEVEDLSFFRHLEQLKRLNLSYVNDVDLNELSGLKNLEELDIIGANIRNPEGLAGLTQLTSLSLDNVVSYDADEPVFDLASLENLTELEWVMLVELPVEDVRPLSGLRKLRHISLVDTGVEDISPLRGMEKLRSLGIFGNDSEQVKEQAEMYFSDMEDILVTEEMPPGR